MKERKSSYEWSLCKKFQLLKRKHRGHFCIKPYYTKEIFRKSLEIMISDHFWLKGTPQKYWHPSVCEDKNLTPSFDMAGYMYTHVWW